MDILERSAMDCTMDAASIVGQLYHSENVVALFTHAHKDKKSVQNPSTNKKGLTLRSGIWANVGRVIFGQTHVRFCHAMALVVLVYNSALA